MTLNSLVMLSDRHAVRADNVVSVKTGATRTEVTLESGTVWFSDMKVSEVVTAINVALTAARTALNPKGDGTKPGAS